MKYDFPIRSEEMLAENHEVVLDYFDSATYWGGFLEEMEHLSNEMGSGINDVCCTFSEEEDAEGDFEGVEFAFQHGGEVVLNYLQFIYYYELACNRYIERYPEHREVLEDYMAKVRKRYGVG